MTDGTISIEPNARPLLPHYVYVLAEPETTAVFYVGMGQGNRVHAHWAEVRRAIRAGEPLEGQKRKQLQQIAEANREPIQAIVARFETREEAFAVEAVLINWMYGFDNLANQNRGRNGLCFRGKDDWSNLVHLDTGQRERVRDGSFANAKVHGLASAGAYDFLNDLMDTLRQEGFEVRDFDRSDDRPYHPGESNGWLGLLVRIEGVDFMVNFSKTKTPALWIATTTATRAREGVLRGLWADLAEPMNLKVNCMGRYRPFRRESAMGSVKFCGADGVTRLVKELKQRGDDLRGAIRLAEVARRDPAPVPVAAVT